jgi:ABC-2 type transport system permease protein
MSSATTIASRSQEKKEESRRAQSASSGAAGGGLLLPAWSLWRREVVRFYRMRSRVIGVIASPVLFWLVLGSGFGSSLRTAAGAGQHYLQYFFPGTVIMIVLFTSIFTMMSVIEDRRDGFLLSVLVSPASRSAIVLGKVLGGATLATIQGFVFLAFAPAIGARLNVLQAGEAMLAVFLVAFALTALGFTIAWPLDSTQAFHAIINLFLIPLWMVSSALFPLSGASPWLRRVMLVNPLTYGVEALRATLFSSAAGNTVMPVGISMLILAGFSLLMFLAAFAIVSRRRTLPA